MTDSGDMGFGRRGFFQEVFARMLRPVADALETRLPQIMIEPPPPHPRLFLRPPGALDESLFNDTCKRCGKCVEVCPAHAIFPFDGPADDPKRGTPVIDADLAACVICEGLQCTKACPSGALRPLSHPGEIRMGTAEVYESLCVRSRGEDCRLCVERCPIGARAIRFLDEGPPDVFADGCTGCGVCQFYCPTTPKAIVVQPV